MHLGARSLPPSGVRRRAERKKVGEELKRPPVMSSGLPGSKLIVYELPRPGFRSLALASEGRESKLLFHQRNKNAVAAGTHSSGYSSRFSFPNGGRIGFTSPRSTHAPFPSA